MMMFSSLRVALVLCVSAALVPVIRGSFLSIQGEAALKADIEVVGARVDGVGRQVHVLTNVGWGSKGVFCTYLIRWRDIRRPHRTHGLCLLNLAPEVG